MCNFCHASILLVCFGAHYLLNLPFLLPFFNLLHLNASQTPFKYAHMLTVPRLPGLIFAVRHKTLLTVAGGWVCQQPIPSLCPQDIIFVFSSSLALDLRTVLMVWFSLSFLTVFSYFLADGL